MRITPYLIAVSLFAASPAFAAEDYTILTIGETQVKQSEVLSLWNGLFPPGQAPDFETADEGLKQNIVRGVVSEYLLYEQAQKQGIDKSEQVEQQLDTVRRKLSVKKLLDDKSSNLISDADVKKQYDVLVRKLRDEREIRARHILVADEAKAKELKSKIDGGADFEALAKENSADPGSAKQGGDLGFFQKGQMVPSFSTAAFALKKGGVSAPVKSDFGWHIIKLEDSRKVKVPTYNDARDQLRLELQEEKLNAYVEGLLGDTKVKYLGADGKEKALTLPSSAKQ